MDLNHIHLHVRDISSSRRFYERYFGFQREWVNKGDFLILQNSDGFDLAFTLDPEPKPVPEWFHFGFRLAGPEAVQEMYSRMVSEGVPIQKSLTEYKNYLTFFCLDPDGYVIEAYWM